MASILLGFHPSPFYSTISLSLVLHCLKTNPVTSDLLINLLPITDLDLSDLPAAADQ